MSPEQTKLLHTLARVDRISANAQLLLTKEPQHDNSVARMRQIAAETKAKIQKALDLLDRLEN
jgi:hypothetical protein